GIAVAGSLRGGQGSFWPGIWATPAALQDLYGGACDCVAFAMSIATPRGYTSSSARGAQRVTAVFTGTQWLKHPDRTRDEQPLSVRPGPLQGQGERGASCPAAARPAAAGQTCPTAPVTDRGARGHLPCDGSGRRRLLRGPLRRLRHAPPADHVLERRRAGRRQRRARG